MPPATRRGRPTPRRGRAPAASSSASQNPARDSRLDRVNIVDELHGIAAALRAAGVPYAVCGGIAVTAYGATRTTKDINIAITRADLSRAVSAVTPLGYTMIAGPMTFGSGTPQARHVQRVSKLDGSHHLVLDLLIADAAYAGVL